MYEFFGYSESDSNNKTATILHYNHEYEYQSKVASFACRKWKTQKLRAFEKVTCTDNNFFKSPSVNISFRRGILRRAIYQSNVYLKIAQIYYPRRFYPVHEKKSAHFRFALMSIVFGLSLLGLVSLFCVSDFLFRVRAFCRRLIYGCIFLNAVDNDVISNNIFEWNKLFNI